MAEKPAKYREYEIRLIHPRSHKCINSLWIIRLRKRATSLIEAQGKLKIPKCRNCGTLYRLNA